MRTHLLACFGVVALIGVSAVACATSEAPNIGEIIKERNATDPAVDSGVSTSTEETDPEPEPTAKKPPTAPPPVVFDAGGGKVDAGDDDDDDNGGSDCDPNNEQYAIEAITVEMSGSGGTTCPNGGSDCDPTQCCYTAASPIPGIPSVSYCVSK